MVLGNNICILDKVALICIKLPYPKPYQRILLCLLIIKIDDSLFYIKQ